MDYPRFSRQILSSLLGAGPGLTARENRTDGDRVVIAGHGSVQETVNQVGKELRRRNLYVQPTLTIRLGFPTQVMVNKDLLLRPWQPLFFDRGADQ